MLSSLSACACPRSSLGALGVRALSQFPQYGCVFYMALATLLKLGMGVDLNAAVGVPAVAAPLGFGLFLYHFVVSSMSLFKIKRKREKLM